MTLEPDNGAMLAAAVSLAALVESENEALGALDFVQAGVVAQAKAIEVARLEAILAMCRPGEAGSPRFPAALRARLGAAIEINRERLGRAIEIQQRVIATVLGAMATSDDDRQTYAAKPATEMGARRSAPVALALRA